MEEMAASHKLDGWQSKSGEEDSGCMRRGKVNVDKGRGDREEFKGWERRLL